MIILDHGQICTIIKRMAIQILENHLGKDIVLCGINQKGYFLAEWIQREMNYHQVTVHRIHLNPANPTSSEITLTPEIEAIENKQIIVVDDVGNTGRTLFYAMKPFMGKTVSGIQAMLLVERMHKAFPMHTDYIGLQLATTLGENIEVCLDDPNHVFARLE